MTAVLLFVAACGVIAIVGWIVSKATGSHAFFVESWQFDDGETILWRDDAADVAVIPKLGQAVSMTPARLHRWPVVVTNSRVIIGNKTLTGKAMVKYVLYTTVAPDGESKHLDGGLLSRGYSTVVIEHEVERDHLRRRRATPVHLAHPGRRREIVDEHLPHPDLHRPRRDVPAGIAAVMQRPTSCDLRLP